MTAAGRLSERTPLRVKLVAAVLLLVTIGLLIAGVAAATGLRNFLLGRVDEQLVSAAKPWEGTEGPGPGYRPHHDERGLPSAYYSAVFRADGARALTYSDPTRGDAAPKLATSLTPSQATSLHNKPFSVGTIGDDGRQWRVVVASFGDGSGTIAIAAELSDVGRTVHRLVLLEALVGAGVLVLVGGLAFLLIRQSLRPLTAVEATAGAIAAGDLSQRVPERDRRTEVGRLSAALNAMLAQVEQAFQARAASEREAHLSAERMRRFVADASHELRTPLTSIRGFAELYRQRSDVAADVPRMMRRIEDEATRMGLLVDDLLLLARLDQQRPLEQRPVDLLTLASDAVHDARAVAPTRSIDLELLDGPALPMVTGDEARLRQVLGNLVSNALTHTPDGTAVTVRVGTRDAAADREPLAVLEVADHGPGLAPDDAQRIFERFYRTDSSRTRARGGSGLGLSIVAALTTAHGGSVQVDTRPGEGATFRVLLPVAKA